MLEAKRRAAIFLILAFLLAAVAGYLVLEKVKQLNSELGGMAEIYVSNGNIGARTLIQEGNLAKMEIPQKFLTDSHITDESEIIGQVSVVPLDAGDIITDNMLKNYSNLQDKNNRLVTLYRTEKIQFDQEVAALDRVDIIISHEVNGKPKTELFMKDVTVAYSSGTGEKFAGVGVEVSSEDATKLIHMQNYAEHIRVLKANVGQELDVPEEEKAAKEAAEQKTATPPAKTPAPNATKTQPETTGTPAANANAATSEGNS